MKTINIKGQSYNVTYNQDKIDFTILQTALIDNNWAKDEENYTFCTFITCKKITYRIFADCRDGSIKITEKTSNVDAYYPWSELKKANKLVGISVNSAGDENDEKWLSKKEIDKIGGWLTFEGEGKEGTITTNSDGSITSNAGIEFTRIPHCPTNTSGVTIGRGFDLKLRNPEDVSNIFNNLHKEYNCELLNDELHNWLIKGCQKVGKNAMQYIKEINYSVKPKNKHISRKKQFFLFKIAYKEKYDYAIGVVERQFKLDMKELPLQIKDVLVDIIYVGLPKDIKNAIEPSLKVKNYKNFREALVDLGKIKKDSRWDKRVKYLDENYFNKRN